MTNPNQSLTPVAAGGIVAGMLGLTAWLASRHLPDPVSDPHTFAWYRGLDKPPFTPPDAAFGVAWPIIETGLAWGGYRLLRAAPGPERGAAVALWVFNVGMIGGWSELFFGGKRLAPSAIAAAGMLAAGSAFTVAAAKIDRKAAATGIPYTAWLGFATLLAWELWRRNPRQR